LFGGLYLKDEAFLLMFDMGQTALNRPPLLSVPASEVWQGLVFQDDGSGAGKFCLHVGIDIFGAVLLAGAVDVDLALHAPHFGLLAFSFDDQVGHVAASQIFVVFQKDAHLLSPFGPFNETFMQEDDGHVDGRVVSARVVRLVDVFDLFVPAVGRSIELHHVLAFYEIIDEGGDEEQGHVQVRHASQGL
jgi:hypothetical protein